MHSWPLAGLSAGVCVKISPSSVHVYAACLCEGERERSQLSTCQPSSLSSTLSASSCWCSLSHGAEQKGVRKASLPLPLLLHPPAFAHHSCVGNVKQAVIEPLYDMLSTHSHIKSRVQHEHPIGYCLTSRLHTLEIVSPRTFLDLRSLRSAVVARV